MPKGSYKRPVRIPSCHPERPHVAKGLCEQCYRKKDDRQTKWNLRQYDPSLTDEEIAVWLKRREDGPCEICGGNDHLMFDHDHEAHKMRGILCRACNSMLGHSDDTPERFVAAKEYLHKKLPKPKLIEVLWYDAMDHLEPWVSAEDTENFGNTPCPIRSIGFLVRQTKHYIVIAGDWNDTNKDYGRVTKIPTAMVVKIIPLGKGADP